MVIPTADALALAPLDRYHSPTDAALPVIAVASLTAAVIIWAVLGLALAGVPLQVAVIRRVHTSVEKAPGTELPLVPVAVTQQQQLLLLVVEVTVVVLVELLVAAKVVSVLRAVVVRVVVRVRVVVVVVVHYEEARLLQPYCKTKV